MDDVKYTSVEVKTAIQEKYLTYCKCLHISRIMAWRKVMLSFKLGPVSVENLKVKIAMRRAIVKRQMVYKHEDKAHAGNKEKKYKYVKDYDSLGPRVDLMFPLVAPDLELDQRLEDHKNWYELATKELPNEIDSY